MMTLIATTFLASGCNSNSSLRITSKMCQEDFFVDYIVTHYSDGTVKREEWPMRCPAWYAVRDGLGLGS